MELSFSATAWKYALLALNILVSLVAVVFMECSISALGGAGSVTGAYLSAILGMLVLTIAFLGCCAAMRESYILSITFVAFAIVGIISKFIFMVTFAAMKNTFIEMFDERIDDLWEQQVTESGAMDFVQFQYHCCGKDSPQDYLLDDDDVLPKSCCWSEDCSNTVNIYSKGCNIATVNFFNDRSDYLMLSIVSLIGLEALATVSAFYLAKSVKHIVHKMEQIVISED